MREVPFSHVMEVECAGRAWSTLEAIPLSPDTNLLLLLMVLVMMLLAPAAVRIFLTFFSYHFDLSCHTEMSTVEGDDSYFVCVGFINRLLTRRYNTTCPDSLSW